MKPTVIKTKNGKYKVKWGQYTIYKRKNGLCINSK